MRARGDARLTLRPGDPGTKRHVEVYGERLVAVRYRYDPASLKRVTTVEIVVDERPWIRTPNVADPDRLVGVRVGAAETKVQRDLRAVGGRWDGGAGVWWAPLHAVLRLGLEERITQWRAPARISNAR